MRAGFRLTARLFARSLPSSPSGAKPPSADSRFPRAPAPCKRLILAAPLLDRCSLAPIPRHPVPCAHRIPRRVPLSPCMHWIPCRGAPPPCTLNRAYPRSPPRKNAGRGNLLQIQPHFFRQKIFLIFFQKGIDKHFFYAIIKVQKVNAQHFLKYLNMKGIVQKRSLQQRKITERRKKIFSCANETTRRYGLCSEFSRAKSFEEGYSNEQFCREAVILKKVPQRKQRTG